MKNKVKVLAFIFTLVIFLNMNVGLSNKYLLRIDIPSVEAAGEWETLISWYCDQGSGSSIPNYYFVYDKNFSYRLRYKAINTGNITFEFNISGPNVSYSCGPYESEKWSTASSEAYKYFSQMRLSNGKTLDESMQHGSQYYIGNFGFYTHGTERGYLYFERQSNNTEPTIAITEPSPNSPLQGRQAYRKGAA